MLYPVECPVLWLGSLARSVAQHSWRACSEDGLKTENQSEVSKVLPMNKRTLVVGG